MARAIFKNWFVNFDSVRYKTGLSCRSRSAKTVGRDTGLPKEIADLFPNEFEDSELGEIPEGWSVGALEDTPQVLKVGSRPKGGVSEYGQRILTIGAESSVGLSVFDYSKTKHVPQDCYAGMKKRHVKIRDVLLYKDGGRPREFEPHVTMFGDGFPFERCAINDHVYPLHALSELGQNYLFLWLSSDLLMEEIRIKGTGVAIPGLRSTQVRSLKTLGPLPDVVRGVPAQVESDSCLKK